MASREVGLKNFCRLDKLIRHRFKKEGICAEMDETKSKVTKKLIEKRFVGKGENAVNSFPNKPWFLCVCSTSLMKTLWEKEKLLVTSNSSFSHSVFYLFGELFAMFIKFKIVVCKLFQFGRV